MTATIQAEIHLVNKTGGSGGSGGGGSGNPAVWDDMQKSLRDIARFVNRPQNIFGGGGSGGGGLFAGAEGAGALFGVSALTILGPWWDKITEKFWVGLSDKLGSPTLTALLKMLFTGEIPPEFKSGGGGSSSGGGIQQNVAQQLNGQIVSIKSTQKGIEQEIYDITKDGVITQEENLRLLFLQKEEQQLITELNTIHNVALEKGVSINENMDALLTSLGSQQQSINDLVTDGVGALYSQAEAQQTINDKIAEAVKLQKKLNAERSASGGKSSSKDMFNFTVNGSEGTFTGRIEDIDGKKLAVGVRTKA